MLFIADTTRERCATHPEGLVLVGDLQIRGRVAAAAGVDDRSAAER